MLSVVLVRSFTNPFLAIAIETGLGRVRLGLVAALLSQRSKINLTSRT